MNLVTEAEVRTASGFDGNADITDPTILGHIESAHGVFYGMIGSSYDLTLLVTSNANFNGSNAHKLMKRIELLLASSYLLVDEYGPGQFGETTDGEDKETKAMDLIDRIISGETKLFGSDGIQLTKAGVSSEKTSARSRGLVGNKSTFSVSDRY